MRKWTLGLVAMAALVWAPAALAASSPTVAPSATTSISETDGTLHGTVNPNGLATTYQFDWGPTNALGKLAPATAASAGAGTAAVAESTKLEGLSPDTTYYFTLVATNADGSSTTPVETFKTTGNPAPGPTTGAATGVGRYQATLTGAINPNNQITSYFFQYGPTASYGFQTYSQTLPAGVATVPVGLTLPGLAPGFTFHYRLVASHSATSISYGADASFETEPFPRPLTPFHYIVSPRKAAKVPPQFTVSGSVGIPFGTPAALACFGNVEVRFLDGTRRVASSDITVLPDCTYSGVVRVPRSRFAGGWLNVTFQYSGDTYVAPSAQKRIKIVAGKAPAKKKTKKPTKK
jgi:hypothetical protein